MALTKKEMAPAKKRFYKNRIRHIEHRIKQQELFVKKVKEEGTFTEWMDADVVLAKLRLYLMELHARLEGEPTSCKHQNWQQEGHLFYCLDCGAFLGSESQDFRWKG